MIVNDKDKYLIDYYIPKEANSSTTSTQKEICENILNNYKNHSSSENNLYDLNKWDEYKDNVLRQLVLYYNFDFVKIAENFDKICKIKRETDELGDEIPVFTEKILRYHWGFLHSRRFFKQKTGEDFYIINKDENYKKNEDKENIDINQNNKKIEEDKNIVNTLNVNVLNNETDLEKFYDKLLGQEMNKDRTKMFEMELKESKTNDDFPISIENNKENNNIEKIINDIKAEANKKINKENKDDNYNEE